MQVGIDTDSVNKGENAAALSPFADFTKAQAAAVEEQIDTVYAEFLQRVSPPTSLALIHAYQPVGLNPKPSTCRSKP